MEKILSPVEARVLGCLVEKEATTPDNYPLSLNALRTACNQKTSRDPVMELDEATVQEAVDSLVRKTLVASRSKSGSRVPKFAHRLRDRLNDEYSFDAAELAVMGMLFLRGAQTRGELRTHCARLHEFSGPEAVEETLTRLRTREDGPYVAQLPVAPGQKEARFVHLACGEVVAAVPESVAPDASRRRNDDDDNEDRLSTVERRIDDLQRELQQLRSALEILQRGVQ